MGKKSNHKQTQKEKDKEKEKAKTKDKDDTKSKEKRDGHARNRSPDHRKKSKSRSSSHRSRSVKIKLLKSSSSSSPSPEKNRKKTSDRKRKSRSRSKHRSRKSRSRRRRSSSSESSTKSAKRRLRPVNIENFQKFPPVAGLDSPPLPGTVAAFTNPSVPPVAPRSSPAPLPMAVTGAALARLSGTATRQTASPACRDFSVGRCIRGNNCRYLHLGPGDGSAVLSMPGTLQGLPPAAMGFS